MYPGYYGWLSHWAQLHVEGALFYLMAFLAIPLAYGVLFDPRIIRCGFLLIGVFGAISGIFLILQAQFLALAQLMIYAVGITLVVVIALMLTNPRMELDTSPTLPEHKIPAIAVAVVLFITIYLGLRSEAWTSHQLAPRIAEDNVVTIGRQLMTYYSIPFEFASVLLLVAVVGAIMLAKADHIAKPEQWIDEQSAEETEGEHNVVKV